MTKIRFDEIDCCVEGLEDQLLEVSIDVFTELGEDVRFILKREEVNRVDFSILERVERMEGEVQQMKLSRLIHFLVGGDTVTSFSKRGISYFVAILNSSSQLSFC